MLVIKENTMLQLKIIKKNKNVLKFVSMITILLGFGVLSGCGMNYKLDDTIYVKNTFLGYDFATTTKKKVFDELVWYVDSNIRKTMK